MSQAHNERLRAAIHRYFREFQPAEADLIADELIARGSMGALLAAADIPDPGHSDDQYAALLNFIRRNGIASFFARVRQGLHTPPRRKRLPTPTAGVWPERDQVTVDPTTEPVLLKPEDPRRPAGDVLKLPTASAPDNDAPAVKRVRMSIPDLPPLESPPRAVSARRNESKRAPRSPSDTIEQTGEKVFGLGFTKSPAPHPEGVSRMAVPKTGLEAPARVPAPVPEAPAPVTAPPPPAADGPWDGVERRSGKERRQRSRRESVEVTFKNKRYGRDRRSGQDRRKKK
jgi:hypothetical protein